MKFAKLGALLIAGSLVPACASGAVAATSLQTRMFLDNVTPNVDFLDRSSRMALDHTDDARVHAFARTEAALGTNAANSLYDYAQGAQTVQVAAAGVPAGDTLLSGRSAAVDGQVTAIDERLPMGQEDLDSLDGLKGQAFEGEYKAKQLDALRQVETDCAAYIAKGDDPVLLAIAGRQLPVVRRQIAALQKL